MIRRRGASHHSGAARLLAVLVAAAALAGQTRGEESRHPPQQAAPEPAPAFRAQGSYCGVYCVHAALHALGKESSLEALIAPKYIGSWEGSTLAQLQRAVEDYGAHALPMQRMSVAALRRSPHPVILHVVGVRRPRLYGHWVLYLGMDGDRARLWDAPGPLYLSSLAELEARWDGSGLVVSDRPIGRLGAVAGASAGSAAWLAAGVALALLVGVVARASSAWRGVASAPWRAHTLQAVCVALIAGAVGLVWHLASNTGLARNPLAVRAVGESYDPLPLRELSADAVREAVKSRRAVVIDSRMPWAYARAHVPSAINLPVDATAGSRRGLLAHIPHDFPLVVYCQGPDCGWDEELASALVCDGFTDVSLFRGGWQEWQQTQKP